MTTYTEFLTRLGDMRIAGVTRRFGLGQTPPASLNAGELPASWVQLPEADHEAYSFGGGATWPTFRAQLIVAVLPTAANTLGDSFDKTVAMMDAVRDALENATLAKSAIAWQMKQAVVIVAGAEYWAIVADIVASG